MKYSRVTVSLPAELRDAAQLAAERADVSFSSVVADALASWVRGQLVDDWLTDHQERFGEFDEDELRALAAETGVPYVAPGRPAS